MPLSIKLLAFLTLYARFYFTHLFYSSTEFAHIMCIILTILLHIALSSFYPSAIQTSLASWVSILILSSCLFYFIQCNFKIIYFFFFFMWKDHGSFSRAINEKKKSTSGKSLNAPSIPWRFRLPSLHFDIVKKDIYL